VENFRGFLIEQRKEPPAIDGPGRVKDKPEKHRFRQYPSQGRVETLCSHQVKGAPETFLAQF